jgi:glycosyltransferase involved in cell wall biosynthesis
MHYAGGVNGVVADLYAALDAAGEWAPYVMISSWEHRKPSLGVDERGRRTWRARMRAIWSGNQVSYFALAAFLLRLPSEIRRALQAVHDLRLGVVNVHYVTDLAFVWAVLKACRLYRGLLLYSFHGTDQHMLASQRGMSRVLSGWLLRQADVLIPCSIDMRTRLLEAHTVDAAKTVTIHNGIDVQTLATVPRREVFHAQKPALLVSLGSFDRVKGHDILLRAFCELHRINPEVRLIIAGRSGNELAELREQLSAARLDEFVEFRIDATREQAMELLANARLFVLASRREGLPLTILEAGALRVPVVVSRVGGIPELVRDEQDGLLPPAEDVAALASALRRMLEQPDAAERMARSLHDRVMSRHTLQTMVASYMKVVGQPR